MDIASPTNMPSPIDRRIALVTGASRGIGAAIAKQLMLIGYFVIGTATNTANAEQITKLLAPNGVGMIMNMSDTQTINDTITSIETNFGTISVLVNNAGITHDALLMRMTDNAWFDVMNVHLNGVYQLSKKVLKNMIKQRFGRIINITSVVAQMGNAGQTNYAAAKAGIEGFSRALAKEVASRNITVNCVAPGMIETDMTAVLTEDTKKAMLANIPSNRYGTPQDVAAAVAFLASLEAGYITGAVIPVNGGLYMS